ncbi:MULTISPECIES: hypothetical protein [unclassified Streptomyces]|uniref:Uncharacterized protein n=1 Tax=Streptomyces sp. NBC_00060 TaxID=2975636 RepID=A0AAU2GRR9_9ACTN
MPRAPEDMSAWELATTFRIVMDDIARRDRGAETERVLAVRAGYAGALWREMVTRGFAFENEGPAQARRHQHPPPSSSAARRRHSHHP